MLKVRRAKRQLFKNCTTFYVKNTLKLTEHIVQVVRVEGLARFTMELAFCDCRDFHCRRLPFIHTALFSKCIHIKAVWKKLGR